MTPEAWSFWAAVAANTPATLTALGAAVYAFQSWRSSKQNSHKLDEMARATNNMKIALLVAAFARGIQEGFAGELAEVIERIRAAETPAAAAAATEQLQMLLDRPRPGPPPGPAPPSPKRRSP